MGYPGHQRSPPPGGPLRGPRGGRSRASLTRNGRPFIGVPFRPAMAFWASSAGMSTKQKPRGRPVSRSLTIFTESTWPCCSNRLRTSSSVALKGRLPTYRVVMGRTTHSGTNTHAGPDRGSSRFADTDPAAWKTLATEWSPDGEGGSYLAGSIGVDVCVPVTGNSFEAKTNHSRPADAS